MPLLINARFRRGPQTGVQRVASELVSRIGLDMVEIAPDRELTGAAGHLWEQTVLPLRCGAGPLWSLCNTGPVAHRNQVVTLHDAAVYDHPEWFSSTFVRTYRAMWPMLARRCRRIVTVSRYSQARLAEALGVPLNRIEVVGNGVSDRFAPPSAEMLADVTRRYGVEPGAYFVTLSTLEPRKNLRVVLDAWARSETMRPKDTKLLLLGGAGASHIFAKGGALGDGLPEGVTLSGFVPDGDLPGLLGGSCGLLYPSRYEGFGLPVIEAMACGVPAVTTALTSLPEVGGDVALYAEPDDPDAWAKIIARLAAEPALREDLGHAGIRRASDFSWNTASAQMEIILRREFGL